MDKLLLAYPWIPKVFAMSMDYGLDWLMMSALALELSGGDPRCRILDHEFMMDNMGPDCPLVASSWRNGLPDIKVIDACTRWGLFQILGRVAADKQLFTGRLYNFADIGSNTRAACQLVASIIQETDDEDAAILYFGANPKQVRSRMESLRESLTHLQNIEKAVEDD